MEVCYQQSDEERSAQGYEFDFHQYEDLSEDGKFYFKENVDARYIKPDLPDYQGNMLIESLPPVFSLETVIRKLVRRPDYSDEECLMNDLYREQAIYRLNNLVIPFVKYADIEKKISIAIRRGYASRKVMDQEFNKIMNHNAMVLRQKGKDAYLEMRSIANSADSTFPGFSLIGISGGGKSTVLNNILALYPQCINHTQYDNKNFLFRQLVYVKINCSHGGALKGICKNFFTEVDSILGTNYSQQYGKDRSSVEDMVAGMAYITQLHAIGLLVIDEIQHLESAKNKGQQVLNFFVNLETSMHIPIIYCGTYKALKNVLSSDFRQARRTSGLGEVFWDRMEKDKFFITFLKEIWKYQWIRNKVELDDAFIDIIYEKTMGITDRVVKLFMAAQLEAILSKREKLTVSLIREVNDKHMKLTEPMIAALRSGNPDEICHYDDLYAIDFNKIEKDYKKQLYNKRELEKAFECLQEELEDKKEDKKKELMKAIIAIGVSYDQAKKFTKEILKENGDNEDISVLKQKIAEKLSDTNICKQQKEKKKEKAEAKKDGYSQLYESGKIKEDIV